MPELFPQKLRCQRGEMNLIAAMGRTSPDPTGPPAHVTTTWEKLTPREARADKAGLLALQLRDGRQRERSARGWQE